MNDSRKLCPTGWHVPDDSEWNLLIKYIDPTADTITIPTCCTVNQSTVAGLKMKSVDSLWVYWNVPHLAYATNESGFFALPGGYSSYCHSGSGCNDQFRDLGHTAHWWSSTTSSIDTTYAHYRQAWAEGPNLTLHRASKGTGYSVRCVKD